MLYIPKNIQKLIGLLLAFVGCVLVFFTSPKVKDERVVVACLIGGSVAIGFGLKLMIES